MLTLLFWFYVYIYFFNKLIYTYKTCRIKVIRHQSWTDECHVFRSKLKWYPLNIELILWCSIFQRSDFHLIAKVSPIIQSTRKWLTAFRTISSLESLSNSLCWAKLNNVTPILEQPYADSVQPLSLWLSALAQLKKSYLQ